MPVIACGISALLNPLANALKAAALWACACGSEEGQQLHQWSHATCRPHTALAIWDRFAAACCCASGLAAGTNSNHR